MTKKLLRKKNKTKNTSKKLKAHKKLQLTNALYKKKGGAEEAKRETKATAEETKKHEEELKAQYEEKKARRERLAAAQAEEAQAEGAQAEGAQAAEAEGAQAEGADRELSCLPRFVEQRSTLFGTSMVLAPDEHENSWYIQQIKPLKKGISKALADIKRVFTNDIPKRRAELEATIASERKKSTNEAVFEDSGRQFFSERFSALGCTNEVTPDQRAALKGRYNEKISNSGLCGLSKSRARLRHSIIRVASDQLRMLQITQEYITEQLNNLFSLSHDIIELEKTTRGFPYFDSERLGQFDSPFQEPILTQEYVGYRTYKVIKDRHEYEQSKMCNSKLKIVYDKLKILFSGYVGSLKGGYNDLSVLARTISWYRGEYTTRAVHEGNDAIITKDVVKMLQDYARNNHLKATRQAVTTYISPSSVYKSTGNNNYVNNNDVNNNDVNNNDVNNNDTIIGAITQSIRNTLSWDLVIGAIFGSSMTYTLLKAPDLVSKLNSIFTQFLGLYSAHELINISQDACALQLATTFAVFLHEIEYKDSVINSAIREWLKSFKIPGLFDIRLLNKPDLQFYKIGSFDTVQFTDEPNAATGLNGPFLDQEGHTNVKTSTYEQLTWTLRATAAAVLTTGSGYKTQAVIGAFTSRLWARNSIYPRLLRNLGDFQERSSSFGLSRGSQSYKNLLAEQRAALKAEEAREVAEIVALKAARKKAIEELKQARKAAAEKAAAEKAAAEKAAAEKAAAEKAAAEKAAAEKTAAEKTAAEKTAAEKTAAEKAAAEKAAAEKAAAEKAAAVNQINAKIDQAREALKKTIAALEKNEAELKQANAEKAAPEKNEAELKQANAEKAAPAEVIGEAAGEVVGEVIGNTTVENFSEIIAFATEIANASPQYFGSNDNISYIGTAMYSPNTIPYSNVFNQSETISVTRDLVSANVTFSRNTSSQETQHALANAIFSMAANSSSNTPIQPQLTNTSINSNNDINDLFYRFLGCMVTGLYLALIMKFIQLTKTNKELTTRAIKAEKALAKAQEELTKATTRAIKAEDALAKAEKALAEAEKALAEATTKATEAQEELEKATIRATEAEEELAKALKRARRQADAAQATENARQTTENARQATEKARQAKKELTEAEAKAELTQANTAVAQAVATARETEEKQTQAKKDVQRLAAERETAKEAEREAKEAERLAERTKLAAERVAERVAEREPEAKAEAEEVEEVEVINISSSGGKHYKTKRKTKRKSNKKTTRRKR